MIVTVEEAKSWLKIDYELEEVEKSDIGMLVDGAESYLKNATGKTFDSTNFLAKLYCRALIVDWSENRVLMQDGKTSEKVRFTLQSIMLQLQYSGGVVEETVQ